MSGLLAQQTNGVYFIFSADEPDGLDPVQTRVYKLNYMRSNDLKLMLDELLKGKNVSTVSTPASAVGISESPAFSATSGPGGGGGGGGGGGAGAGSAGTTGGNTLSGADVLIVQAKESILKTVDEIVRQLDVQPIQVLIEAVIVSVELDKSCELGVNFAVVDNLGRTIGEVGNSATMASNVGFTPLQVVTNTGTTAGKILGSTAPPGLDSDFNGIKFGFIGSNTTAFVHALETIGEVNVLASPRILVLNKQRADIQLGQRLGYQTLSQNLTSTIQQVQFLNVGTLLRLRPYISEDRMIRMEIHPERSSGSVTNNLPSQNISAVTTNVMVPDGATIVIGGLIDHEDTFQYQGLPGLNRLPLLGTIFGFRQRTNAKRELIVLLTPHIWDPNGSLGASPALAGGNRAPGAAAPRDAAVAVAPGSSTTGATRPTPTAPPRPSSGLLSRLRAFRTSRNGTSPAVASYSPRRDDAVVRTAAPPSDRDVGTAFHLVRRGETLASIARDRLGDSRRAAELYQLNRDTIADANHLVPGQRLVLPAPDSR